MTDIRLEDLEKMFAQMGELNVESQTEEFKEAGEKMISAAKEYLKTYPDELKAQVILAEALFGYGVVMGREEQEGEAVDLLEESLHIWCTFEDDVRSNYRMECGTTALLLGELYMNAGRVDMVSIVSDIAIDCFERAEDENKDAFLERARALKSRLSDEMKEMEKLRERILEMMDGKLDPELMHLIDLDADL